MSYLDYLWGQYWWYDEQHGAAEERYDKYTEEHESLTKFKKSVETAQAEFEGVNSSKSGALSKVNDVKKNSITAQRYYTGMNNIFSGVGTKVVARVYAVMLEWISKKLTDYTEKISEADSDRQRYAGECQRIYAEICAEQQKSNSC